MLAAYWPAEAFSMQGKQLTGKPCQSEEAARAAAVALYNSCHQDSPISPSMQRWALPRATLHFASCISGPDLIALPTWWTDAQADPVWTAKWSEDSCFLCLHF